MQKLKALLIKHEGMKFKPYTCSAGKLTIGIGRNLEDVGLSAMEVDLLLSNDIARVSGEAVANFPWFRELNDTRKDVVLSMLFNIGRSRFKGFKKMIAALERRDYQAAAYEMLTSKWSEQVGQRANELAHMMSTGEY